MKHLLDLSTLEASEILSLVDLANNVKNNSSKFASSLKDRTLLMIFAKPSLRTRVSFEVGMTQLGGHAIYYDISTSPMGKKESIDDTAKTVSRYCDIIMARLFEHKDIVELAQNSSIPVINALTNYTHPCQILSDFQTIKEKKGLDNLKLSYLGDANNNVTHSLLFGCSILGIDISIGCPQGEEFEPQAKVLTKSKKFASNSEIVITHSAQEAVKDTDIVYTDSWMSYHIPEEEKNKRMKIFMPYQVNSKLISHAKPDAIFMNCLPALRGMEQTSEVIDGPQSVVFDQAENRLHMQKALILRLLRRD